MSEANWLTDLIELLLERTAEVRLCSPHAAYDSGTGEESEELYCYECALIEAFRSGLTVASAYWGAEDFQILCEDCNDPLTTRLTSYGARRVLEEPERYMDPSGMLLMLSALNLAANEGKLLPSYEQFGPRLNAYFERLKSEPERNEGNE